VKEPFIDLEYMLDILALADEIYTERLISHAGLYPLADRIKMQNCRDHARDLIIAFNNLAGN
jgi:hypothetical protein